LTGLTREAIISITTLSNLEGGMSWKLAGSYFETYSVDVVCPCTASLALGATLDRCEVTLVFNVRNGEVEGLT
jgi:hypothetical protein